MPKRRRARQSASTAPDGGDALSQEQAGSTAAAETGRGISSAAGNQEDNDDGLDMAEQQADTPESEEPSTCQHCGMDLKQMQRPARHIANCKARVAKKAKAARDLPRKCGICLSIFTERWNVHSSIQAHFKTCFCLAATRRSFVPDSTG